MAYVYHNEDGEIYAVSKENILTFDFPCQCTFVPDLNTDIDFTLVTIDSNGVIRDNVARWKEFKKDEIKSAFENTIAKGFTCPSGFTVDTDRTDIMVLDAALRLCEKLGLATTTIRDFNNIVHEITLEQLNTLIMNAGVYYQQILGKKWYLQDLVDKCSSLEEIKQINWE